MAINKLIGRFSKRPAPTNGTLSSKDYNASFDEMMTDLSLLVSNWNEYVQPLLDSLPTGGSQVTYEDRVSTIDPWANGFDGSQVYMDQAATGKLDEGYFYDTTLSRPLTIKEVSIKIRDGLGAEIEVLENKVNLIDPATGLSEKIKSRIGINIFDEAQASSNSSLDGLTQLEMRYLRQLAADVFNEGKSIGDPPAYIFGTTGAQTQVPSIVDRLVEVEADIVTLLAETYPQTRVHNTSADGTVDDTYAGSPSNLLEDLNLIRATIRNQAGSTAWTMLPTRAPLGSVSVQSHINMIGTMPGATPSARNPHATGTQDLVDYTAFAAYLTGEFLALDTAINDLTSDVETYIIALRILIGTDTGDLTSTDVGWTPSGLTYIQVDDTIRSAVEKLDVQVASMAPELGSPGSTRFVLNGYLSGSTGSMFDSIWIAPAAGTLTKAWCYVGTRGGSGAVTFTVYKVPDGTAVPEVVNAGGTPFSHAVASPNIPGSFTAFDVTKVDFVEGDSFFVYLNGIDAGLPQDLMVELAYTFA